MKITQASFKIKDLFIFLNNPYHVSETASPHHRPIKSSLWEERPDIDLCLNKMSMKFTASGCISPISICALNQGVWGPVTV